MLLKDSCLTVSEVSEKLKIDFSTAYRYLNQMVKAGILTVIKSPDGDRFDFSSVRVFKIIEEATTFVIENERKLSDSKDLRNHQFEYLTQPQKVLDVRGQLCPVPEIMTRKELKKLQPGEILIVVCDYPLSKERIISFSVKNGYSVTVDQIDLVAKIYIQKPDS